MAISKLYSSNIEDATKIMGIPFIGIEQFITDEFNDDSINPMWTVNVPNIGTPSESDGKLKFMAPGGPPPNAVYVSQFSMEDEFDLAIKVFLDVAVSGSNNTLNVGMSIGDETFLIWSAGITLLSASSTEPHLSIYADGYVADGEVYDETQVETALMTIQLRMKYAISVGHVQWFYRDSDLSEWTEIIISGVTVVPPAGRKIAYLSGTVAEDGVTHTIMWDYFRSL